MVKNVVFHSTSDQESNDIKKMFPKSEVIQIPNLLKPNPRFDDVQTKKELLFIGRIHPIKAIHKLIEGLSQSEEFLNSGFKLNIVGKFEARHEDYYRSLLSLVRRFMLEDRVLFLGHVEGSAKERLYAQSYFTILPSETENFGNVVVESLNQGTPVIASFGTPWAILEENGCGYHVSNSVDALTNVINRALKLDQEEYLKKRENAYALIDKQFDIDKQIHRWLNQYKLLYNV
jgi:glycosyltransferase involved in cell wall biosynthesis